MRRRRWWKIALGILFMILALVAYAAWPGSSTFTIGPDTTYVTGPLDKHGYIDYVTALNERLRGDITPETNANVLIWQALGPHPEGATMPPEYFQWLGYEPPEQGEYFVIREKYLKERLRDDFSAQRRELTDRMDRAIKRPWTTKDEPELAEWLRRNEKPLAEIIRATQRLDFYNPLVPRRTEDWSPGLYSSLLPSVQICREVAAALACRAMLRLREGKTEKAWEDLLACHRLGRLVARGTLIEWLVGFALEKTASNADLTLLAQAHLSSKQAIAYLHEIQSLPPMPAVADRVDQVERFFYLDTAILFAKYGTPAMENLSRSSDTPPRSNQFRDRLFTRSINWDPAFRNGNRWYDRCAAASRIANRKDREDAMIRVAQDAKALRQEVGEAIVFENIFAGPKRRGELIGNILIGLMLPAFQKLTDAEDRYQQGLRNLHLAFALAGYRADHGRYPAKLDELAPKYIESISDDLFAGKPLNYRLEGAGYLLYSVGPDGIDDGGRSYDDEPRGDDIALRMPVPEPPLKK
jgi:hypothetical protein